MATKAAAPKPSTKRHSVNWKRIQQMWDEGKSYRQIAAMTDPHYNTSKADPTKSTRAKVSNALRIGVMIDGQLLKFKPRAGMRAIGVGKEAPKAEEVAKPKPRTPAKKKDTTVA